MQYLGRKALGAERRELSVVRRVSSTYFYFEQLSVYN